MSTRTDWGLFRQDGSRLEPVAVGDEHAKWQCPNRKWTSSEPWEHPITGELEHQPPHLPECPFKYTGPKREACTRCNVVFIYP